jgi:hypothetical protein
MVKRAHKQLDVWREGVALATHDEDPDHRYVGLDGRRQGKLPAFPGNRAEDSNRELSPLPIHPYLEQKNQALIAGFMV